MSYRFSGSLVFLLIFSLLISSCSKNGTQTDVNVMDSVRIGGLYSITGNWSTLGKNSAVATKLAVDEVNKYLQDRGVAFRLAFRIYDTQLDTSKCLAMLAKAVDADKVTYFVGPQSSAELSAIKGKIEQQKLFVVSQGSTASSLSLPGDAIFRFCPGDKVEGRAIARTMFARGKTNVITLSRDDAGNRGLQEAVGSIAQGLGSKVEAIAPYPINTSDFSTLMATLRSKIQQLTATAGADRIAIFAASFDELKDLFKQASNDAVLSSVEWYGGDGVVLSDVMVADTLASSFAQKTNFVAPNFAVPLNANADHDRIAAAIKGVTGIEPDAYALAVYDAIWVIARTLSSYPDARKDWNNLKLNFPKEANQFYGITGPIGLDQNGDRSIGTFDYYGIRKSGSVYRWIFTGKSD